MADIKNDKNFNSPALRFPGFTEPWQKVKLKDILKIGNGKDYKHLENGDVPVFGSGGLMTMVNQSLYVGETVFIGRKGSIDRPFYYNGAFWTVDTLFYTHSFSGVYPRLVLYLFQKIDWYKYNEASGVPSLSKKTIEDIDCFIPSIPEQGKLIELLSLLDERIATQRRLIEDFISLRRALLQNAISRGLSKKSWKLTSLNDILTERGERNSAGYDVCSVSVSEGVVNQIEYLGRSFAAKDTGHYNVARYGDIIYTKSPTGSFPYGIVKRDAQKEPAAISPLYGVFVPKHDWIGILLGYYFESEVNTFNYLHPIIQKGAKNTINITNSGFLANNVPLPIDESEALVLAKCLETISHKIVLEKSVLAHYTEQREYLLSKMFV